MPQRARHNRLVENLVIIFVLVLGLAPRLYLLVSTGFVIDSDEAIVGLMAKHISEGREWPVFYYGQDYMGSFESILVAALFKIFGVSAAMLMAVPLMFSLLHILAVYALARLLTDRRGALIAAILTALAPNALILWSTKPRGGFIELVVLGTLTLIVAVKILNTSNPKQVLRSYLFLVLGIILGFGWWVNNQILFYLTAIGLTFFLILPFRAGLVRSIKWFFISLLGFFIGGAPFWYANLTSDPQFASLRFLFSPLFGERGSVGVVSMFSTHLEGFFQKSIPILLGARRFWTHDMKGDVFNGATYLLLFIYSSIVIVGLGMFLIHLFSKGMGNKLEFGSQNESKTKNFWHVSPSAWFLIWAFLIVTPSIFAASPFGSLSEAPRYLLPLYSVVFIVVGTALSQLFSIPNKIVKTFSLVLLFGVISLNLSSNYAGGFAIPGQPFVYKGERVSVDHAPLYDWLNKNHYTHVRTNYWIGYRLAFETNEKITFSRFRGPRSLRIPDYERQPAEILEVAPYVLVSTEASYFTEELSRRGFDFRVTPVSGYLVIDNVLPQHDSTRELQRDLYELGASSREDWLGNLKDGELGTRWGSGEPQHTGMYIAMTIADKSVISIEGIGLDLGLFPQDFPRRLLVEGITEDGEKCVLYEAVSQDEEAPGERMFSLHFPPLALKGIVLRQLGTHPVLDWSVAELVIYAGD